MCTLLYRAPTICRLIFFSIFFTAFTRSRFVRFFLSLCLFGSFYIWACACCCCCYFRGALFLSLSLFSLPLHEITTSSGIISLPLTLFFTWINNRQKSQKHSKMRNSLTTTLKMWYGARLIHSLALSLKKMRWTMIVIVRERTRVPGLRSRVGFSAFTQLLSSVMWT